MKQKEKITLTTNMELDNTFSSENSEKIAMKVSKVSIFVNFGLSVLKLLAGLIAGSGAMISDGIHSASDVLSTIIVIIGIKISNKKADKEHPYGHERMECVAAIILAVILVLVGLEIGSSGVRNIINGNYGDLQVPGILALIAAIVSILVKEWMFRYTKHYAKQINSSALMADGWHHRSDALSSIGAFIGIFGARLGFPIMDSVASVIICLFIAKAAYDIFKDAIDKMVDRSCDAAFENELEKFVREQDGVINIDNIKTRMFGSRIYVDLEVGINGKMTLYESHSIAHEIHEGIEKTFTEVKHISIHVNPK